MLGLSMGFAVAVSGLAVGLWRAQRTLFLTQYLFFLRYPLSTALLLWVGPPLARTQAMLANLFVLPWHGTLAVTALSAALASATLYQAELLLRLTPVRTGTPLFRRALSRADRVDTDAEALTHVLARHHGWWVLLLIGPLVAVLVSESDAALPQTLAAVLVGILLVRGVRWVARRESLPHQQSPIGALATWLAHLLDKASLTQRLAQAGHGRAGGFVDQAGHLSLPHARALVFLLLSLALYGLGYVVLGASFAGEGTLVAAVPALAYALIIALMLGLLMSGLSFLFDVHRVPPLALVVAFWGASYFCFGRDHIFPVAPVEGPLVCDLPPEAALRAWYTQQRRARPSLVLVAASGGGIAASLWTASVLTSLSDPTRGLGSEFARAIALISSASGGGLGAAYFVDAYLPEGPPAAPDELARIVAAAGASSLNQTAYALAYNDFPALFLPWLIGEGAQDRGWALEKVWRKQLRHPDATLRSFRSDVARGIRPAQVFNATIAETGERLLLSTLDCPTASCGLGASLWRAQTLRDMSLSADIQIATAARLSATFPWVTPLARPPGESGYHVADGGYYDNFGVTTTLEWLSRVHAELDLTELVGKVILVEIRASSDKRVAPVRNSGWLYSSFGPLVTLLNVRSTSQRDHNEAALSALKALLSSNGVPFERVSFDLATGSPLSWHLSHAERADITAAWGDPTIQKAYQKLSCLWRADAERWGDLCGSAKPVDLRARNAAAVVFEQAKAAAREPPAQTPPKAD